MNYWGLNRHPFHNIPDPKMYFKYHDSVAATVKEIYFAIEEGDESIAVIVGEAGLGKTLVLRILSKSLNKTKYSTALVVNPGSSFSQLLRETIGQLTNTICDIQDQEKLLDHLRQILVQNSQHNKRVVVFIDEAHVINRENLERLRLLTNLQEDENHLFTIVLAGQSQLANEIERPEMRNLFQRIDTYCKLEKLPSLEVLRKYIQFRMSLAGCAKNIFTDDAISRIWIYAEQGVPRLVNRLCKLALKKGAHNKQKEIDNKTIEIVAARFSKTNQVVDGSIQIEPVGRDEQLVNPTLTDNMNIFGNNNLNNNLEDKTNDINQPIEMTFSTAHHQRTKQKFEVVDDKLTDVEHPRIHQPEINENKSKIVQIVTETKSNKAKPDQKTINIPYDSVNAELMPQKPIDIQLPTNVVDDGKWEGPKPKSSKNPEIQIATVEEQQQPDSFILKKPESCESEIEEMEEERNKEIINRMRDRHQQRMSVFKR